MLVAPWIPNGPTEKSSSAVKGIIRKYHSLSGPNHFGWPDSPQPDHSHHHSSLNWLRMSTQSRQIMSFPIHLGKIFANVEISTPFRAKTRDRRCKKRRMKLKEKEYGVLAKISWTKSWRPRLSNDTKQHHHRVSGTSSPSLSPSTTTTG